MKIWQAELKKIHEETSPEAMEEEWAVVLAGLGGVRDDDLGRLALKAQALAAEERDEELRRYLEDRIDEIVFGRWADRRRSSGR